MKYQTKCKGCGLEKNYTTEFEPKFCLNCGGELEVVSSTKTGKTSREKAEEVMRELDDIVPRLKETYEAYLAVSVEWYDRRDRLQYYQKRGVVSGEEVERYIRMVGMDKSEKPFAQRLKEYRASKKKKEEV